MGRANRLTVEGCIFHGPHRWPQLSFPLKMRIPMKADICSDSKRTPFLGNRTVVGAKRRSGCFINGCPNRVKIWPPVFSSLGAPLWGDGLWPSQKVPAPFIGAGGRAVVAALELRARAATGRHCVTDSPWPAQIGAPVTRELQVSSAGSFLFFRMDSPLSSSR